MSTVKSTRFCFLSREHAIFRSHHGPSHYTPPHPTPTYPIYISQPHTHTHSHPHARTTPLFAHLRHSLPFQCVVLSPPRCRNFYSCSRSMDTPSAPAHPHAQHSSDCSPSPGVTWHRPRARLSADSVSALRLGVLAIENCSIVVLMFPSCMALLCRLCRSADLCLRFRTLWLLLGLAI